ncbi:hypothetical protein QJQ45_029899 [Haematococcus lacustris]|nr:hypothetical protein QJQ45_029899 [Haematococcus lacustris]
MHGPLNRSPSLAVLIDQLALHVAEQCHHRYSKTPRSLLLLPAGLRGGARQPERLPSGTRLRGPLLQCQQLVVSASTCSGSSFQSNSSPLCLVIRAQPATSTICDVSATAHHARATAAAALPLAAVETAFIITPNEGPGTSPFDPGAWPVWQILTVTGAAATCLLLVLGTVLLLICCRWAGQGRRTNSVASYPSSKPAGPAAPCPSPLRPSPGLGALTPTGGFYPMSAPAAYAPMYPHRAGGAYQPQPTPPAMSSSIAYPPAYFQLQQPRGAGAG